MEFEYKIKKDSKISAEVFNIIAYKSGFFRTSMNCILGSYLVTMVLLIYLLISFKDLSPLKFWTILGTELAFILIIIAFRIYSKSILKKAVESDYLDTDSTYKITIIDGKLIRENEFSTLEVKLSSVINIDLLKHGVVINACDIHVYIPKESIPIGIDEFISMFDEYILIEDYSDFIKKRQKSWAVIVILVAIISVVVSIHINKDKAISKPNNLIIQEDLVSENNGYTYHYVNGDVNIHFPKSWNGHYGINVNDDDETEVFYLPEGNVDNTPTLLFKIVKGGHDSKSIGDKFIKEIDIKGEAYSLYGPGKDVKFKGKDDEYAEYKKMFYHIENLPIN